MNKKWFRGCLWVCMTVMIFSVLGCAVGFHKRSPQDIKTIKSLSEQLEDLRRAKSQLERQLREELARGDVSVTMEDRGLVVTVVAEVLFDSGKAQIRAKGKPVLGKVADVLAKIDDKDIDIEGHTDNVPIKFSKWKSNWELSSQRALNVLHFFVDDKGLSPQRFSATGCGPYQPVVSNDTKEGRQKNRRVEIIILSSGFQKDRIVPSGKVEEFIK